VLSLKDINLLPDELKGNFRNDDNRFDFRDKVEPKTVLIYLIVAFAAIMVFFAPVLFNKYLERNLSKLSAEERSSKFDVVREVNQEFLSIEESLGKKKAVYGNIQSANLSLNEVLVAVKSVLPPGVVLNGLNYDGNRVTISGALNREIQIGEIISRVERSQFFELDDRTAIAYNDQNNFSLNLNVVKGKDDGV
jgi:Tfp pilus assembly protein PilN